MRLSRALHNTRSLDFVSFGHFARDDKWMRLPRPFGARNDKIGIDAIAVTYGPGLIGSLLVGVETAKTLALIWNKPLIPVNHLLGHFYANWITDHLPGVKAHLEGAIPQLPTQHHLGGEMPKFPCIGLLVSGGHTDLILMKDHDKYEYLGGTRDDASGECFDKCARLLGLPYPGGPSIAKAAGKGNPKAFDLPRPMLDSKDFDFSFSGLKTAVANLLHTSEVKKTPYTSEVRCDLAASIEAAIVDVLVAKTIKAAKEYKIGRIIVAGGVASNQTLAERLITAATTSVGHVKILIPPPPLCTDNAAMIASAAFFNCQPINPLMLQADPGLSLTK